MATGLNGSTKWIMVIITLVGIIVSMTAAFTRKADRSDVTAAQIRITAACDRVTVVEKVAEYNKEATIRIEKTVDKIYDLMLEEKGKK